MNVENSKSAIAIIGMSGRFPGAATVEEFWKNLVDGVDTISRFSPDELEFSVASEADKRDGQKFVGARGVLANADLFDAAFFNITPREAELMDPQHRIFLECAWEAFERAGYNPEAYPGLIGVYAGSSCNTYLLYNLCRNREFAARLAANFQVGNYSTMLGNNPDFLATRLSYKLDLKGPSMAIQTACSTSLVGVCQACMSLLTHQCDLALAGAVSISFPQKRDYLFQEGSLVSGDGVCRAFDAAADGTVFGHGAGAVLLKRLDEALADGDNVLAVITGTAVNNDGAAKVSYAAPSVDAQAGVIAMAQAAAGVDPETVSYIEAHGTGTPLGDPIEMAALTQAFRAGGATRNGYCAVGTAKTYISHLDVAAGVTGLIKTVLQLQHEKIPPLLHFKAPNPKIDFANSPFFPVAKMTDWKRGTTPRRAGVSAFGVGGTNAHVVVEEAPAAQPSGPGRPWQLLLLSARSEAALKQMAENLAQHLESHPAQNLADIASTLQRGRKAFPWRQAVIARDTAEAAAKLRARDGKPVNVGHAPPKAPAIVFMFPGQGSQYLNMGREMYELEPVFRAEVDRCADLLRPHLNFDLRQVIYPAAGSDAGAAAKVNQTIVSQPAIFTVAYSLAKLWQSWGIEGSAFIGHSLGEFVAAVLAGCFELGDALALVSARAKLVNQLPGGSMLAVRMDGRELEPQLPAELCVAAFNSSRLCTISGPTPQLQAFHAQLQARKIVCAPLPASHAFHSPMMAPMVREFTEIVRRTPRHAPRVPWVSTCTGNWVTPADMEDPAYWALQVRNPVRFVEALDRIISQPDTVFLEVGPGIGLGQLAQQHPSKPAGLRTMPSLDPNAASGSELATMLGSLGRLWVAGARPDWEAFQANQRRLRVPLPTYPFERKRYWVEPDPIPDPAPASPTNSSPAPSAAASSSATGTGNSGLELAEKLIHEQLKIMARQLEAMH
jgi:acyl transferase domain-containing protein